MASGTNKLGDLPFSDLYVRVDSVAPSRYISADSVLPGNQPVPHEYEPSIEMIRGKLYKAPRSCGIVTHDDMRLRFCKTGCVGDTEDEEAIWAALRRIPVDVPLIEELSMHPDVETLMRGWSKLRGLVLIGGQTGAGKTTTAVACLNTYLNMRPDTAVTIEDPPEYDLRGPVGLGSCFQFEVKDDEDWSSKVNDALRFRPQFIFLGEIRTPKAAAQALRAATSGHLVISTVHGGSVEETLSAILRLAEKDMGNSAKSLLAETLVAAIHQRLGPYGPIIQYAQTATRGKEKNDDPLRKAIEAWSVAGIRNSIQQRLPTPKQEARR